MLLLLLHWRSGSSSLFVRLVVTVATGWWRLTAIPYWRSASSSLLSKTMRGFEAVLPPFFRLCCGCTGLLLVLRVAFVFVLAVVPRELVLVRREKAGGGGGGGAILLVVTLRLDLEWNGESKRFS
jgi:hypothetical protein